MEVRARISSWRRDGCSIVSDMFYFPCVICRSSHAEALVDSVDEVVLSHLERKIFEITEPKFRKCSADHDCKSLESSVSSLGFQTFDKERLILTLRLELPSWKSRFSVSNATVSEGSTHVEKVLKIAAYVVRLRAFESI